MVYAVYDKATKQVIREGIASTADNCALQITTPAAQDVVYAPSADGMEMVKAALGLTG